MIRVYFERQKSYWLYTPINKSDFLCFTHPNHFTFLKLSFRFTMPRLPLKLLSNWRLWQLVLLMCMVSLIYLVMNRKGYETKPQFVQWRKVKNAQSQKHSYSSCSMSSCFDATRCQNFKVIKVFIIINVLWILYGLNCIFCTLITFRYLYTPSIQMCRQYQIIIKKSSTLSNDLHLKQIIQRRLAFLYRVLIHLTEIPWVPGLCVIWASVWAI